MSSIKMYTENNTRELQESLRKAELGITISASALGSKASEFATEVTRIVSSNDFMGLLSNEVGEPRPGETEDEFVERAKARMRSLLKMRLESK